MHKEFQRFSTFLLHRSLCQFYESHGPLYLNKEHYHFPNIPSQIYRNFARSHNYKLRYNFNYKFNHKLRYKLSSSSISPASLPNSLILVKPTWSKLLQSPANYTTSTPLLPIRQSMHGRKNYSLKLQIIFPHSLLELLLWLHI